MAGQCALTSTLAFGLGELKLKILMNDFQEKRWFYIKDIKQTNYGKCYKPLHKTTKDR